MVRTALHLQIRDGKRQEYREEHEDVHDSLEKAYLESGSGLKRFSVFEKDGHVFVFIEAEDPNRLREVMETSEE